MATKLITLVPSLSTEEIQAMIDAEINKLDFQNHTHATSAINSGTLAIANGGTEASTAAAARTNLEITPANIGAATVSHSHSSLRVIPTYNEGWSQYPGTRYNVFYQKTDNIVVLSGPIIRDAGNQSTTNVIFQFNPGFRPSSLLLFNCWGYTIAGSNVPVRVDINSEGFLFIVFPAVNSLMWVSLNGIVFPV